MHRAPDPKTGLKLLIILVAALATVWSAAMLTGGFIASGQLNSPFNPLGSVLPYLAAASMMGAVAIFYFALGFRERASLAMIASSFVLAVTLSLLASLTQTYMVVDASMGAAFVRAAEAKSDGALKQRVRRIDAAMTGIYLGQVDHMAQRMEEEAATGRGPRFREAEQRFHVLRATYGSAIGAPMALGRGSRDTDLAGLADAIEALKGKASLVERFASEVDIRAPEFRAQIDALTATIALIAAEYQIDRRSLVYRQVITKLGEMLASFGTADLGFTLAVLLSLSPDLIQMLCTILLLCMRREQRDLPVPPAHAVEDLPFPPEDWEPREPAWGRQITDTVH